MKRLCHDKGRYSEARAVHHMFLNLAHILAALLACERKALYKAIGHIARYRLHIVGAELVSGENIAGMQVAYLGNLFVGGTFFCR